MNVLILAPTNDPHASAVSLHLSSFGVEALQWQQSRLLAGASVSFRKQGNLTYASLHDEGCGTNDLMKLQAVWLRRPALLESKPLPTRWMSNTVEWESSRGLAGIWASLPCLWVNQPLRQAECHIRNYQVHKASESGLLVPKTLVSNDVDQVRQFYEDCKGKMVCRLINESNSRLLPEGFDIRGMRTVAREDLELLEQVRYSLHMFQEKIDGQLDVSVIVVANKVFAAQKNSCRHHSTDRGMSESDIRKHVLPDEVSSKCLHLMGLLGLQFAIFDFCLDADSRYYLIDVKTQGDFLDVESTLELPISRELALLLSGRAPGLRV